MTQSFFVPGPLPGLNEVIAAAKSGHGRGNGYARLKQSWTDAVWALALSAKLQPCDGPASVCFEWRERDRRRDPDNVAGARKFLLDGLVKAGVLADDGWDEVEMWIDRFQVDKAKPGVLVTITTA